MTKTALTPFDPLPGKSYATRKLHCSICDRSGLLVDKFNVRGNGYVLERRFTKFGEIAKNKGYYAVQGHSMCIQCDFGANRKLICDFLLVINTNLPSICTVS